MTWIAMAMRKMQLKKEVSNLQFEDTQISNQIQNLANYANNIADGVITCSEMASCPSSLFGTQLDFMTNSASVAYQSAQTKANAYIQQLNQTNNATGNQYGYTANNINNSGTDATTIFNEIYKEELKEYAQQMQEFINNYEQELEQEKERIETQLTAKQAEMQAYEQSIKQNIQQDAIKLA